MREKMPEGKRLLDHLNALTRNLPSSFLEKSLDAIKAKERNLRLLKTLLLIPLVSVKKFWA